jgi:hypothetical protein
MSRHAAGGSCLELKSLCKAPCKQLGDMKSVDKDGDGMQADRRVLALLH